jgi:hypothetical protein
MISEDRESIFKAQTKSYEIERDFEWHKWNKKIPSLQFPSHWYVKIIPPFAAAMIRFTVSLSENTHAISVYLDCYGTLGGVTGKPYWEIYPAKNGDAARYKMSDVVGLLEGIEKALGKNI